MKSRYPTMKRRHSHPQLFCNSASDPLLDQSLRSQLLRCGDRHRPPTPQGSCQQALQCAQLIVLTRHDQ